MYSAQTTIKYRSRKDKVNKKKNKLIFFIFLFFLLIAIIIFLNSSISKITEIELTGLNLLAMEDIYLQANLDEGMYYFLASKSNIKEDLLDLEEVKDVEVLKEFPGKLLINIIEKKTLAYILIDAKWIPLLEDGQLYHKNYSNDFLGRPLVTNWSDMSLLKKLVEELNKTNLTVLKEISEIQQNSQEYNPNQLLIFTNDGYRIHVVLDNFSSKLNLYPEIKENLRAKTSKIGDIYMFESLYFEEFE